MQKNLMLSSLAVLTMAVAGCGNNANNQQAEAKAKPEAKAGEAKTESTTTEAPTKCEIDRPVVFGELDWNSARFHTDVARYIIEKGYKCKTDAIPGSTTPIFNGMLRGDIDIMMEIWTNNTIEVWEKGLKAGKFAEGGSNFNDAKQGWYVPRYVVEGENAPAKGLKKVHDLAKFKDVFKDPEEPTKGRFLNCISGWSCEVTNAKKLKVYGLADSYNNFRPGTSAALDTAVISALKKKKPVLFYYWEPSQIMGKYGKDLIKLEEPAYDKEKWETMLAEDNPKVATDFPISDIIIGLNKAFKDSAPQLTEFLDKYQTHSADISRELAYMQDNDVDSKEAAIHYLKTTDEWHKWAPEDVIKAVEESLKSEDVPEGQAENKAKDEAKTEEKSEG